MRHTETRKREKAEMSPTAGLLVSALVLVVLLLIGFLFVFSPGGGHVPTVTTGINTSQSPGEVRLTFVDSGNVDSLWLFSGPDRTSSTEFSSGFQEGAKVTMRSNSTVHNHLENTSMRIPVDGGGFMTIDTPSDVTTTQLSFQGADLSDTNYTPRTAYLACLYEPEGFELDGEPVPSDISIPCHSPVLAQTDSVQSSTKRDGDTVTTPILLKEGEYQIIGVVNGRLAVVESIEVSEEIAGQ